MKGKIKSLIKRQTRVVKMIRRVQRKSFFRRSYKKNIHGVNDILNIKVSALLIGCKFDIIGNNNKIIIEESASLYDVTFLIRGNNNLINISREVVFDRGGSLWIEDDNCILQIGKQTTFVDIHIAVTESNSMVSIGEDCMFAYDIDLRTGDSHSIIDTTTMMRINYAKNIEIGDHVWVASHVTILKGARIQDNSVVATRSLVTNSFDKPGILIGGIPAKTLKENIDWNRNRI
jgi:acetyltransferase-like isoleucine patch superfamily enzyme